MYLDNIAPEIRLEILQLCSPKDLASLASVHSSLRDVADHALYTHIYLSAHPFDLIQDQKRSQEGRTSNPWALKEHGSLLHTLSTSAWKAKIVKSLYIELHSTMSHHEVQNATRSILIKLSQLLKNMPNLVDFRIIYDALDDPSEGRLSEALRRGRFQLHTLWLDESHDLKGIVTNQPNLRLLGVYYGHRGDTDKHLWRQIKGLFQTVPSTRTMPTICMLNCYSPWVPMVNIFPAYHRPGEVVREFQEIVRSLFEFPKRYLRRRGCNITFDLFGIKKENINLLGDVMEGIATCIRSFSPSWSTTFLEFTIDDTMIKPWHFPGSIRALPLFEHVEDITFNFRGVKEDELGPFYTDLHLCLMKDLGKAWPKVQRVRVRRKFTTILLDRESDWSPTASGFLGSDSEDMSD